MMFLKAVLITALFGALFGIVVMSVFGQWPDWRQMRFPDYVLLALAIVVFGFYGLLVVGYTLFYIGLWPLYVQGY
jgi:hypothetical protein